MAYKILETKIIFDSELPSEIIVLWDDNGLCRATIADRRQKSGYKNLTGREAVSIDLIQEIAGYGSYLTDEEKKKHFPNVTNWAR